MVATASNRYKHFLRSFIRSRTVLTGNGNITDRFKMVKTKNGSSAPRDPRIKKTSANDVTYVLDIADIALRPSVEVSLILRKPDERRKTTQTWKFTEDGRLCCGPGNTMCVESKEGAFGLRDGGEAMLAPTVPNVKTKMDLPLEMMVGRQKMRPGSDFLSVKVVTDGPTRVLQIMDVTHQNYSNGHSLTGC